MKIKDRHEAPPHMDAIKEYLNTVQLADLLGVSPRTIEDWRQSGEGPPFCRMGGRLVRYRSPDVDEWLISRRAHSTSQESA